MSQKISLIVAVSFVAVLASWGLLAADPPELADPKSDKAMRAKSSMIDNIKKLDEEYTAKVKKAREAYIAELEIARKEAIEKSDLDEAQRIVAAKTAIQEDEKNEATPGYGFKIHSARWGAKKNWVDVTTAVRKMIKNNKVALVPEKAGFQDPIFGTEKSLVIVYSLNSKVGVVIAAYDQIAEVPPSTRKR